MSGRKRWPVYRQPDPVPSISEDFWPAIHDAVARATDAMIGAVRKSMDGPDWATFWARLNDDERRVAEYLLARGKR